MESLPAHSIDNYLAGKATPEEKAQVEAWYQSCQRRASLFAELSGNKKKEAKDRMWAAIEEAVQTQSCKATK